MPLGISVSGNKRPRQSNPESSDSLISLRKNFPSQTLTGWYLKTRRDLPWRKKPSPYKIWVSEIMLQQTQVSKVVPYYRRFLKKFPRLATLARSKEADLLNCWSGLGYYSRARHMLKAAKIVAKEYGGHFPKSKDILLKLPGIGPYTAGAILSIAYELPVPILDGNVRRVLSRFYLENSQENLWKISGDIVSDSSGAGIKPSHFNQSLMELGALICLPKNPLCPRCPIGRFCRAKKMNRQSFYPPLSKKSETIKKCFALLIAQRKGKLKKGDSSEFFILRRSGRRRWLKGMWELPSIRLSKNGAEIRSSGFLESLEGRFGGIIGARVRIKDFLGEFTHHITRNRIKIIVLKGEITGKVSHSDDADPRQRWIFKEDLKKISHSSMLGKALNL